jgi:hypothetical protein
MSEVLAASFGGPRHTVLSDSSCSWTAIPHGKKIAILLLHGNSFVDRCHPGNSAKRPFVRVGSRHL